MKHNNKPSEAQINRLLTDLKAAGAKNPEVFEMSFTVPENIDIAHYLATFKLPEPKKELQN